MTRELWLLRHGKAGQNTNFSDFDRPLKKRGKRAALRMGSWLKQKQLIPDYIVSSPAKSAISTTKKVRKAMVITSPEIVQDKRLYEGGAIRIKNLLAEIPSDCNRVLLVGHNPELEDLLTFLVDMSGLPEVNKLLPTTTLVRLVMPSDWTQLSADCATLLSITRAKSSVIEDIE